MLYFNVGKAKILEKSKFMYHPNRIQLVKITIYPEFTTISWESIMPKLLLDSIKNPSINFQLRYSLRNKENRAAMLDVHCSSHSNLLSCSV